MKQILAKVQEEHGATGAALVEQALEYAKKAHQGQVRDDGSEFWTHPAAVTAILVGQGHTDPELLAAALLHDAVEDTSTTLAQVKKTFGATVAFLVDGATDVGKGDGETPIKDRYERMGASQEKILRYGEEDHRVFLIKAADRIHNLRTMKKLSQERQERIRREAGSFHHKIAKKADEELADIIADLVEHPI